MVSPICIQAVNFSVSLVVLTYSRYRKYLLDLQCTLDGFGSLHISFLSCEKTDEQMGLPNPWRKGAGSGSPGYLPSDELVTGIKVSC